MYGRLCWSHYPISRYRLSLSGVQEMLAVCVDFEIDMASLDAFLTIMEKNAADSLANEVDCHQFDIAQDPQTQQRYFFMNFMMTRSLLSCIKRQVIISNSMTQSAVWLIKNRSVCFRKLTTNFGAECPQVCFISAKNICCF